ncbi:putative cobalt chelatase subunit [Ochrobactrum phage vB_OspM_OC]|nr:putative cobalt chelatase subunit [Ochrobactrum phage vB_OspM_OC]
MTIIVPKKKPEFVKTAHYDYIEKVILNKRFKPVLLVGETGSGKSMTVEQACAHNNRPMLKFSVTKETTKDDLMGGFRLKAGETIFQYGPVTEAMQQGAVLVLDEFDCAHPNNIMCLQSVMEGNGYHIADSNETILPAPGFQIFLTANTKGQGDETGKYIGTQYLNEAFLERIAAVLEFDYMSRDQELESFKKFVEDRGIDLSGYTNFDPLERIADYASQVREAQKNGGHDTEHTLSSRRLKFLLEEMESSGASVVRAMRITFSRFADGFRDGLIDFYISSYEDDSKTEDEQISEANNFEFYSNLHKKLNANG